MTRNVRGQRMIDDHLDALATPVESALLEDTIVEADQGDELLEYLADAAGSAHYAEDEADQRIDDYLPSDPVRDPAGRAADDLRDALEQRVVELVAERCAWLLDPESSDEWVASRGQDEVAAARREAAEWLVDHGRVAESIGIVDDVEELAEEAGRA